MKNAFDTEIGPDGNLYVTSQQGACVVRFYLDGNGDYDSIKGSDIFIGPHEGGLQQAKTIHFTSNNVPGIPEPGAVSFGLIPGVSILGLMIRKRRKY